MLNRLFQVLLRPDFGLPVECFFAFLFAICLIPKNTGVSKPGPKGKRETRPAPIFNISKNSSDYALLKAHSGNGRKKSTAI